MNAERWSWSGLIRSEDNKRLLGAVECIPVHPGHNHERPWAWAVYDPLRTGLERTREGAVAAVEAILAKAEGKKR